MLVCCLICFWFCYDSFLIVYLFNSVGFYFVGLCLFGFADYLFGLFWIWLDVGVCCYIAFALFVWVYCIWMGFWVVCLLVVLVVLVWVFGVIVLVGYLCIICLRLLIALRLWWMLLLFVDLGLFCVWMGWLYWLLIMFVSLGDRFWLCCLFGCLFWVYWLGIGFN